MPRVHEVKSHPRPFLAQAKGLKTFEFRWNDRDYQVGDELHLREKWRRYTGLELRLEVTYMLLGGSSESFGVPPGYAVLSTRVVESCFWCCPNPICRHRTPHGMLGCREEGCECTP